MVPSQANFVLFQAGNRAIAIREMLVAEGQSQVREDLAKALAAGGRNAEAIEEFEAAVAIEPGPGSLQALATLYAAAGNSSKALDALRRAGEQREIVGLAGMRLGEHVGQRRDCHRIEWRHPSLEGSITWVATCIGPGPSGDMAATARG